MNDAIALRRRGLILECITLGWNVIGTVVVIIAAIQARSVALAGFGLDSLIEIFASLIVIWQLKGVGRDRESVALRCIAVAFAALALYVLAQAAYTFASGIRPTPSISGIVWLVFTVIVMVLLAWGKLVVGRRLNNPVLVAESHVTVVDAYLAAAVLVGVGLNASIGWWWADPVSSLIIVYYGLREATEAWRHAKPTVTD